MRLVRLLHPEKAFCGIDVSHPYSILQPLPIGPAVLKLLHPKNAEDPMFAPFGIVIFVRLLHPENANPPMLVTPSGIVMLVRLLQYWKA